MPKTGEQHAARCGVGIGVVVCRVFHRGQMLKRAVVARNDGPLTAGQCRFTRFGSTNTRVRATSAKSALTKNAMVAASPK